MDTNNTRTAEWRPQKLHDIVGKWPGFRRNRRHLREVELPDSDTATDTTTSKHFPEEGEILSNRQTSNATANSASRTDSTADDYVAASADESCGLELPTITKDSNSTDAPSTHTPPDMGVQSFDQNGSAIEHYKYYCDHTLRKQYS